MTERNPYGRVRKIRSKKAKTRKRDAAEEIEEWRTKWREAGPVRFAEEVLKCWPEVPPHPKLGRVPECIVLSEDQKAFITILWERTSTRIIVSAGRGAGKTFCIAIYVTWRVCCFNYYTLTVMGGSGEQSEKIKEYVDFWRDTNREIAYCIDRSIASGNRPARVESRWGAYARFPACSEAAARGPHVIQMMIDEVCVGESKSSSSAKAVRAAPWQLTGSSEPLLVLTSTAQYILGTFYRTWVNAEKLGFIRFRWSIAQHTSAAWYLPNGKPNWTMIDEILYKDRNPNNWKSNVWWITDAEIKRMRQRSTDDEWLVEALGGMSRGSGLVFSREDLRACICTGIRYTEDGSECEECEPYTDKCPMMRKMKLSSMAAISDRKAGIDFGTIAPNAITIVGRRGKIIFALHSDERTGLRSEEVLEWIYKILKKYNIYDVYGDPEARSMIDSIELQGYSTPNPWATSAGTRAKRIYTVNVRRFIEKHMLFVPKVFSYLVNSLAELSYDEKGSIRKSNDHSFDSLMLATVDFTPDEDSEGFYREIKDAGVSKIWT